MNLFIFPFLFIFFRLITLFIAFIYLECFIKPYFILILWSKKDGSYDFFYDICRISWTI